MDGAGLTRRLFNAELRQHRLPGLADAVQQLAGFAWFAIALGLSHERFRKTPM